MDAAIPSGVAVPNWAYYDYVTAGVFNLELASQQSGPESTAPPGPSSTVISAGSTATSAIATILTYGIWPPDKLKMPRPTNRKRQNILNLQGGGNASAAKKPWLKPPDVEPVDPLPPPVPIPAEPPDAQNCGEFTPIEPTIHLHEPEIIDNMEGMINTHPEDVAALVPEVMEAVGVYDQPFRPDAPDEPEDYKPVLDETQAINLPNTPADSHDPLIDEAQALQASIAAVVSPFQNAPIPRDIALLALAKLNLILRPSQEALPGYKPPKLDSMFSIR
ncbi:hypothetical protein FRC11_001046 [Ceratobasidium sp. 423]|nr:hypothetical protein FRC11_001046 [Ceratobasidium sp. 423]